VGVTGLTFVVGVRVEFGGADPIGRLVELLDRVIFDCCGEGGGGDLILDEGLLFHPSVWSLSFLIPEVPIGTPYAYSIV